MFKKLFKKCILLSSIVIFCSACSFNEKNDLNNNINPILKEKLVEEITENVISSVKEDLDKYFDDKVENQIDIFDHPIDVQLGKCIDNDSTTAGMIHCGYIAIDGWNTEINRHLQNLKKILPPEKFALVQDSQAKWEEYKNQELMTLKKLVFEHEGTFFQVAYAAKYTSIVKERAMLLDYYEHIYSDFDN